jgi:O-antigen ligase
LWALDVDQGSIELLFFVFPFTALVAAVARAPYAEWLPRALALCLVGLAALFATVGLYQAWSHTLIFAQDLRVANAYTTYFRVTSLFKDPSIYGRHLVLAISLLVVLLWLGRVRLVYAAALVAILFGGLYFSYSQSSMVVLFVTVLAATLLLADRRSRTTVAAVAVAVALVGGAFALMSAKDNGLRRASSGRSRLVSLTTTVIRNHPVVGVGIGSQPLASRREVKTRRPADKNASHTTPLTVFAELGVIGFALYVLFLGGAARPLLEATRLRRPLGLGLAVVFLALFLHSLFYSGFFEDPIMWGTLAVAALVVGSFGPRERVDP